MAHDTTDSVARMPDAASRVPDARDIAPPELGVAPPSSLHGLQGWLMRWAASGWLPIRGFWPRAEFEPQAKGGRLRIEIVSHCWNYSHLLEHQLGSLVLHPPREVEATMTVYFCREDRRTARLLEVAAKQEPANVRWQWRALAKEHLFRRSIGRNHAALATRADWIWFTDCDLLFGEGCLDALGRALQGRVEPLVYPRQENLTTLLDDAALAGEAEPRLRQPSGELEFSSTIATKAKGPLQITHGDVARALGYCRDISCYQRAEREFQKCREDTAFRWILGTHGVPIDLPGVSRLRHASKGRYHGSEASNKLRLFARRLQERWRARRRHAKS
jgi:hypothetical protein